MPRKFESGDITEWLNRFKICTKANGWDISVKAVELLTLLEGKAQPVWLDFTKEEQGDYSVNVDKLKRKLARTSFSSSEAFHTQKLQPHGKVLSLFLQDLKQKLQHAMPNVCMWSVIRPHREELQPGKLRRDVHVRLWASRLSVGPNVDNVIIVATVRSSATTLTGELTGKLLLIKEEADKLQDYPNSYLKSG